MYYAKARFYDAHDRRFTAVDPILDPSGYDLREYVQNPVQLVQYLYVQNKPLVYIDMLGEDLTPAVEGTVIHLAIELYTKSLHPKDVQTNIYVAGVFDTKSGGGYIDFLRTNVNGYTEIYEIKPSHWQYNEKLDFLSVTQMYSYVNAINNHPEKANNMQYNPAKPGTSLLEKLNGAILPHPVPKKPGDYIKIRTDSKRPGMVYYRICNCPDNKKLVYDYAYTKDDEEVFKPFVEYEKLYSNQSIYVTNIYDTNFMSSVRAWRELVSIGEERSGNIAYTVVTFPDGQKMYRCDGSYSFWTGKRPEAKEISDINLLSLYFNKSSFNDEYWGTSQKEAYDNYTMAMFLEMQKYQNISHQFPFIPISPVIVPAF